MRALNTLVNYFRDKALKKEDGEWKALEGGCVGGYWIPYTDIEEEGVLRNSYTNQPLDKSAFIRLGSASLHVAKR